MEWLLTFINNNGLLPIVAGFLCFLFIVLAAVYVVAFIQGREVSFWPPTIGKGPIASDEKIAAQGNAGPNRFVLNCCGCGNEIVVTNPRLKEEPKRVYMRKDGCSNGATSHGFSIGCPKCPEKQYVQFEY